jgi:hypothetical protein
MPVHDWTRVQAGTFHDFHCAWITHVKESLNGGLLPEGYYALAEQHAGKLISDVLTLRLPEPLPDRFRGGAGLGVAEAPPRVARRLVASPEATYRMTRRTLTIRHTSGHRIVAILEVVSPANKDRGSSVAELVDNIDSALHAGCHVLLVDLFPPGPHDPRGIHGSVWDRYDPALGEATPAEPPFALASYVARPLAEAYVEYVALGEALPEMPLFLQVDSYVNVPLEATYQAAHRGLPLHLRQILDGLRDPEPR